MVVPSKRRFAEEMAPPPPLPIFAEPHETQAPAATAGVERLVVGKTREGNAEVRLSLGPESACGVEVRLIARPGGVEATFLAASAAARREVETKLAELARALEARGVRLVRLEARVRGEGARR